MQYYGEIALLNERQKRNDTIKVPIEKLIQIEIKFDRGHLQMYHYGRNLNNGLWSVMV